MKTFEFTSAELHLIQQSLINTQDRYNDKLDSLKNMPKRDYEINYYTKALAENTSLLVKLGYSE